MDFTNKKNAPPENKPKEYWRLKEWFPDISEETDQKLKIYFDQLNKFNRTLGLVSEKTMPMADVLHFSDCILAIRKVMAEAKPSSITDIGTGNGFPGIVLATLFPNVKVSIIDKDPKRIEFLKSSATLLGLKNLECIEKGIDSITPLTLEKVIVRAPTPLGKALLALRRQVRKGGSIYFLKGEEWASEVANMPSQLCTFWAPNLVGEYRLPLGEVKFAVIRLDKIAD